MQFDHKHYIPCLRWKQGEYLALSKIDDLIKKNFTPLIEVPEIGWDFEKRKNIRSLKEHLISFTDRVNNKWGKSPCIIDIRCIKSFNQPQEALQTLRFIFSELRKNYCFAIPTVNLNDDREYQDEIKTIIQEDEKGLCLRISLEQDFTESLKEVIDKTLSSLKIHLGEIHLILDIGAPNYLPLDSFLKFIKKIIFCIPYIKQWKTFSILGTSIPESMSIIKKDIEILDRYEWIFYKRIIKDFIKENLRLPTFSDYAINHPKILPSEDMRRFNPSAKIKYTIDDKWLVIKGKGVRTNGFEQFRKLCKKMISTHHYCGPDFSNGDDFIEKCANGKGGTGNLSTWIQIGTSHHIQKVLKDIANFYDS